MPTWPATLPQFVLQDGYGEGFDTGDLLRTEMDVGPPKRRNRSTASTVEFDAPIEVTTAEFDILKAFYRDDLSRGALSFDYTHPRTGAAITVAFRSEPKKATPVGPFDYRVMMELEQLP